jgi:hypothetical protein
LRYGVLVHASPKDENDENDGKIDLTAVYADYLKAAGK